jgi:hypothetical protein
MRRRHLLTFALAAASALLGASCLSPTLPLPPPDVESIQETRPKQWTIAGSCFPGAIVSVFNQTQNQGVLIEDTENSGRFVVTLTANLCDVGWAAQVSGPQASTETSFVVEAKSPNDPGTTSTCH